LTDPRLLINRVGFLDGDQHIRDQVTDDNYIKTFGTVAFFSTIRPALVVLVGGYLNAWDFSTVSPWLPVELLLYAIVLDFWFYTYHRACHEIGPLWQYHRTHHLTKHPIPVLASFSDGEQELIEVIIVPLLSFVTLRFGFQLPMPFYDWWICQAFILFAEIMGHSGLRVYAVTPGLASFVLSFFGCELIIEDHDLHHRQGYRKSGNYGKQTKLWDRLFGTEMPRIESENVDFDHGVHMPFF
jgi:sterol desaturase/sphingolipid hydroxylase (fatty acid hydroxylase superfamily)